VTDSGFFGWVWRFNALAIAVAASGAIVALALMFVAIVGTFVRDRTWPNETGLVEQNGQQPSNVSYALGHAEEAEGTNIVIHTLDRRSSRPVIRFKSSYGYEADVVNLLVVDDAAANGRWMFEGVGQTLLARSFLYDPATVGAERGKRRATALLIEMSDADTNKDGAIDARDGTTVLIYKLSDGSRTQLLKGSLNLTSVRQADNGRVLIMYDEGEHTILASYDAVDFHLIARNELPRLSTAAAEAGAN
jgi:hypothetical protein